MAEIVLRDYQAGAVEAVLDALMAGESPVVSLPTGSGKSLVAGEIARRVAAGDPGNSGQIIISVPSRELCAQNEDALVALAETFGGISRWDIGVCCAALGRFETDRRIVIGTPQSLATRWRKGKVLLVEVDEAHQMPLHKGSNFDKLFEALPGGRSIPRAGLSGTTFRTAAGRIFGSPTSWFTKQVYEVPVQTLIDRGHLSKARYVKPKRLMNVSNVGKSAGDYNQKELVDENIDQVPDQIDVFLNAMERENRKKGMIFAVTVDHAMAYVEELGRRGTRAVPIVGALGAGERSDNVRRFRSGEAPVCVTVVAALTGFDVPDIDIIASARPTCSAIIHTQSLGRGSRVADGKTDCLVLDFANNIPQFGPTHDPHFDASGRSRGGEAPWRPCPACGTYSRYETPECPHCHGALKVREAVTAVTMEYGTINFWKENQATEALIAMTGSGLHRVTAFAVHAYRAKNRDSESLMLSYSLGDGAIVREWFKYMNSDFWRRRWSSLMGERPFPTNLQDAYRRRDELLAPSQIMVTKDGNFWKVISAEFDDEVDAEAIDPAFAGLQHPGLGAAAS